MGVAMFDDHDEWFECSTCCYGTNSAQKMDDHEDEHIRRNRPDPWTDIPIEYKEFFYDSTLEE
jgi:hypothetical protein